MSIKDFLDKKPTLSELFNYVEEEAKRIASEKKRASES